MAQPLTYQAAGVDIHEASRFVQDISGLRARTEKRRKLLSPFGLFAASYDLSAYKHPVIVTGCDGVGTKLELLLEYDELETAGKDLVAMNVNDVLTTGADPIMFLDYVGVPKIDRPQMTRFIAGMVEWLESCDCVLAGGETAEMPGIVPEGMYELSGFCIGAAEKGDLLEPASIAVGDVLIGYASSGFHANGWSLVRRVLKDFAADFTKEEIRSLLVPTKLYHEEVRAYRQAGIKPKAMSHITGGGLIENLERLFLEGLGADLEIPAWDLPVARKVVDRVDATDALSTFNLGIGWVTIVSPDQVERALAAIPGGRVIGTMVPRHGVKVQISQEGA